VLEHQRHLSRPFGLSLQRLFESLVMFVYVSIFAFSLLSFIDMSALCMLCFYRSLLILCSYCCLLHHHPPAGRSASECSHFPNSSKLLSISCSHKNFMTTSQMVQELLCWQTHTHKLTLLKPVLATLSLHGRWKCSSAYRSATTVICQAMKACLTNVL